MPRPKERAAELVGSRRARATATARPVEQRDAYDERKHDALGPVHHERHLEAEERRRGPMRVSSTPRAQNHRGRRAVTALAAVATRAPEAPMSRARTRGLAPKNGTSTKREGIAQAGSTTGQSEACGPAHESRDGEGRSSRRRGRPSRPRSSCRETTDRSVLGVQGAKTEEKWYAGHEGHEEVGGRADGRHREHVRRAEGRETRGNSSRRSPSEPPGEECGKESQKAGTDDLVEAIAEVMAEKADERGEQVRVEGAVVRLVPQRRGQLASQDVPRHEKQDGVVVGHGQREGRRVQRAAGASAITTVDRATSAASRRESMPSEVCRRRPSRAKLAPSSGHVETAATRAGAKRVEAGNQPSYAPAEQSRDRVVLTEWTHRRAGAPRSPACIEGDP